MIYAGVNGYLDKIAVARVRAFEQRPADAAAHQARRSARQRSARAATCPTPTPPSSRAWSTATPRRSLSRFEVARRPCIHRQATTRMTDRWPPSRTCAFASPPPRRRRRSPRPCRWSRRPSCAARRRRRKPRVLMPSAWTRCSASSRRRSPAATRRRGCWPAPATTRCICWWSAPPSAACAARSTRRSCGWRASRPTR